MQLKLSSPPVIMALPVIMPVPMRASFVPVVASVAEKEPEDDRSIGIARFIIVSVTSVAIIGSAGTLIVAITAVVAVVAVIASVAVTSYGCYIGTS
jgi:glucan phosphoethanolaminetransferase (alkaline phosphatase superfamily)